MSLLRWFNSGTFELAGVFHDMLWSWITITLSLTVCLGYSVIAFNWFFQAKLARHEEAHAALARLRNISLSCAVCGLAFYYLEIPWLLWRAYDAILILLAIYTWTFVVRMRGLSLLDERLAQVDELERSATKYREIAELLPHMIWTATANGHVDFSNQRWREYVGGADTSWIDAVHPEDRQQAAARWTEALVARQPTSFELRLRGVGGYRTFHVKATPIFRGSAIKWLGACADIEDQKRLAAQQEMQFRQKSFFLNALSHDLRAPLHNVLLNAQLLRMTARDESDAESVRMIVENAVAAGDLITRLLEFAKAGAQDHNAIEPVYVHAILQQVARRFLPLAETRGLHLVVAPSLDGVAATLAVHTDRQKLERIVSNLVDNAIKYTDRDGVVTLSLRAVNSPDASPHEVVVAVSDTGAGIPPQNVPYLFDEFYQVNNYERDRSKGFGMGLAICKCLARQLGGDVRLASTTSAGAGRGSCFELLVPAASAPSPSSIQPEPHTGDLRPDRGGRPLGETRDLGHSQAAGLCGI